MPENDPQGVPPANSEPTPPAEQDAVSTDTSPVGSNPPTEPTSEEAKQVIAEPLSDGTTPTVLTTAGDKKTTPPSGKLRSLGSVYRKADFLTTAISFGVTLILAIGGFVLYTVLTANHTKKTAAPQVSVLDQSSLSKLGAYFSGDTTGSSAQVLTINSASLFKGRVALNSDLKVVGAAEIDGPTQLSSLTVDQTSTLGVTNIRGQLVVEGPLVLQSPATLSAGATVTGNITASGNGSFGGSISAGVINAPTINVSGNLNVAGHLVITGSQPTATTNDGAGSGATATVDGTDSAGTITINTGTIPHTINASGGLLGGIAFHTPYAKVPRVLITPGNSAAGGLGVYVQKTSSGFTIGSATNFASLTGYTFDYWVVQ